MEQPQKLGVSYLRSSRCVSRLRLWRQGSHVGGPPRSGLRHADAMQMHTPQAMHPEDRAWTRTLMRW